MEESRFDCSPERVNRRCLAVEEGGRLSTIRLHRGEIGMTGSVRIRNFPTHGKFLTYPPGHTIQGTYTAASPEVITLTVPIADVGGGVSHLVSVIALSATQLTSSSGEETIFNQIDATASFASR
jgi:hypothetical protein